MIINGRFVHSEPGGFRRYADEVAARMPNARIVSPPARFSRGAIGKLWEQTLLARRARNDVLWSPATSGPLRHRKHVVTLHDVAPLVEPTTVGTRFASVQRRLLPALARGAAQVVVDSAAIAHEMRSRFDVPADRLTVACPGVSEVFSAVADVPRHEARRALGLGGHGVDLREPLIGGLVSSIPRKNSEAVISTLETVVAAGAAQAVVAGWDGPSRVFGKRSRPTSTLVTDLGSLSDDRLALFYRALDVFVWLPDHEGFGLPVAEAASAGTPVVCTSVPAATERLAGAVAVVDDVAGAIVEVRDLLADPDLADHRARRGAEAAATLTWDATAKAVASALEKAEVQRP